MSKRGTARTRGELIGCVICLDPIALGQGRCPRYRSPKDGLETCNVRCLRDHPSAAPSQHKVCARASQACGIVLHVGCKNQYVDRAVDGWLAMEPIPDDPHIRCPHCRAPMNFTPWPKVRKKPLRMRIKETAELIGRHRRTMEMIERRDAMLRESLEQSGQASGPSPRPTQRERPTLPTATNDVAEK